MISNKEKIKQLRNKKDESEYSFDRFETIKRNRQYKTNLYKIVHGKKIFYEKIKNNRIRFIDDRKEMHIRELDAYIENLIEDKFIDSL